MSEPRIESPIELPHEATESAFGPLALMTAGSFGLLVLATMGPKLWATQTSDSATLSIEIMAIGQVLLAAIAWPLWTRTATSAIAIVLSSPAWIFLAGRIAASPLEASISMAWKLTAVLAVLVLVRVATPRTAVRFVWAAIAAVALGGPALWMLARGG